MRGWECDGEPCCLLQSALDVELGSVILNDAVDPGEADSAAVRLGGKERLKDVPEVCGCDALAGVAQLQHEAAAGGGRRHRELAAPRHRLDRVEQRFHTG